MFAEVSRLRKTCEFLKCVLWSGGFCTKELEIASKETFGETQASWLIRQTFFAENLTKLWHPDHTRIALIFHWRHPLISNDNIANICRLDWRLYHRHGSDGHQSIHQSQRPQYFIPWLGSVFVHEPPRGRRPLVHHFKIRRRCFGESFSERLSSEEPALRRSFDRRCVAAVYQYFRPINPWCSVKYY